MNMSERLGDVWPRMRMIGLRVGALVLLFYGASFYTRDWRSLVSPAGQSIEGQVASRSKAVARPLPANRVAAPAPLEPATTGALPRVTETVAGPAAKNVAERGAAERDTRPSASAPPRLQAQAVAPGSRMQHKPNKRTQVAARPAVKTASVNDLTPSRPEAAVQSRPEEPVQFRLAERSN
jgi:hypothetical protein